MVNSEDSYVVSRPIKSHVHNMILKIEEMYDWTNGILSDELTEFLKEKMHASKENIKFLECNSLSTIKEITIFGIRDIYLTLHKFPNHIQDQDFLNWITMIHHLAEFCKIAGEEAKPKDSTLQPPPTHQVS